MQRRGGVNACIDIEQTIGAAITDNRIVGTMQYYDIYIDAFYHATSSGIVVFGNAMDTGTPIGAGRIYNNSNSPSTICDNNTSIGSVECYTPIATMGGVFSALPGSAPPGTIAYVTDGNAAHCGDGTCTTWGTTVTGGSGTIKLLVWQNGTNWTLIGK
jgi:hypothetical protein